MAKLTNAQLSALKDISIYDYLLQKGYKPTHRSGNSYFFDLTNSDKKTGETSVMINTNRFHDFSDGKGGDIIQLVQQLENVDFKKAVELLSSNTISQVVSTQRVDSITKEEKKPVSFKRLEDRNKLINLFSYASERGIDSPTIDQSKVEYIEDTENKYYYLGLKNDSGGYSIRNKHMKGARGDNNLTTIINNPNGNFIVVEGMFEYLSILEATCEFDQNFIVLNSTSFAENALEFMKQNTHVNFQVILNNDEAGNKASEILAKANNAIIYTNLLPNKSDLNQELLENGLYEIKKTLFNISPLKQQKMETTTNQTEKLDQTKKRELFLNHLKENGAGGLSYNDLEKKYSDRSQKPGAIKTTFLDDIVGKGISDVFEFYVHVFQQGAETALAAGKTFEELLKEGEIKIFKKQGRIKMDIFKDENGNLKVNTLPITKQQELKKPEGNLIKMINYKATDDEITRLFDKKETVLIGDDDKKFYARVDFETNNIILKNQKAVSPNFVVKSILGTELSQEERTKLYDGKAIDVKVENFVKKNGEVMNGKAKVQYDPITNSFNVNKYYSNETLSKFNNQNTKIANNLKRQYEAKALKPEENSKTPAKKHTFKKP